jgi:hypothetical protein
VNNAIKYTSPLVGGVRVAEISGGVWVMVILNIVAGGTIIVEVSLVEALRVPGMRNDPRSLIIKNFDGTVLMGARQHSRCWRNEVRHDADQR